MSANNGGPAFPADGIDYESAFAWPSQGMTLRDYFAAKALVAGIRNGSFNADQGDDESYQAWLARCAYRMADAMLAARGES